MDFILPIFDYRKGRGRFRTGARHDEMLPVGRNIELKVARSPVLRDARNAKQRLGRAKIERSLDRHGVQNVVQTEEEELAPVGPPAHEPGAVSGNLAPG